MERKKQLHNIKYIFPVLKPVNKQTYNSLQTYRNNYKIHVFQFSFMRITFKIPQQHMNSCLWGDYKNIAAHQTKWLVQRYGKPMMTGKCGVDVRVFEISHYKHNWLILLVFRKTADFVLRIPQGTNTRCGPDADMLRVQYVYLPPCYKQLTLFTHGLLSPATLKKLIFHKSTQCLSRSERCYSSA